MHTTYTHAIYSYTRRYLHYYQRYHAHDQALKYAAAHRSAAELRMAARQESARHGGGAWIDVQYLKQVCIYYIYMYIMIVIVSGCIVSSVIILTLSLLGCGTSD